MTSSDVVMIVIEGVLSSRVIVRSSVSGPFWFGPMCPCVQAGTPECVGKEGKREKIKGSVPGIGSGTGVVWGFLVLCLWCVCVFCGRFGGRVGAHLDIELVFR